MKTKFILLALLYSGITMAQTSDVELLKKNEISSNLLDLVVAGSLNVNYERLLEKNQSFYVGATFFDTYGYYDAGYIESTNAISLRVAYILYFSKRKAHEGFYFYPQLKVRSGEVVVEDYFYYDFLTETEVRQEFKYDVSGFSAGFGIGHKWVLNDKIVLSLNGEIARNLGSFDTDYLGNIEARFGVNLGYRF